jgi:hypothetical protein
MFPSLVAHRNYYKLANSQPQGAASLNPDWPSMALESPTTNSG